MSEAIAQAFHEAYERLAPSFGYSTREASAKPWSEVPQNNRSLMIATVDSLVEQGIISSGLPTTDDVEVFDSPQRSALRACRYRLEEMRTAVIAARVVAQRASEVQVNGYTPVDLDRLEEASRRWLERFGALADPPLTVEVEEDDDPDGTPVEGAYSVTESETEERSTPAAERERALWTKDIARMLRDRTAVAPELRPGHLAAADWLDPPPSAPYTPGQFGGPSPEGS